MGEASGGRIISPLDLRCPPTATAPLITRGQNMGVVAGVREISIPSFLLDTPLTFPHPRSFRSSGVPISRLSPRPPHPCRHAHPARLFSTANATSTTKKSTSRNPPHPRRGIPPCTFPGEAGTSSNSRWSSSSNRESQWTATTWKLLRDLCSLVRNPFQQPGP